MTAKYSANETLVRAGTVPLAQGVESGELKTLIDSMTADGAIAIGDTILCSKLPPGAIVMGIKLINDVDLSASAITLDVGDNVDDNRYWNDLDVSSVGEHVNILQASIGHKVGVPSDAGVPADDDAILITVAGGAWTTAVKLTIIVYYI